MNKTALVFATALIGLSAGGCHGHRASSDTKPTVTTGMTDNREERMRARIDELKAKGYPEERATRIAAKEVSAMETTYSESLGGVLTGKAGKEKADQAKFEKDFAKSAGTK